MNEMPSRRRRADSYKLLSECYHLPDERLLRTLKSLGESAGGIFSKILKSVPGGNGSSSVVDALKIDHSRLFVGPFKLLAPPYGSVYLEGERRIMGDSTVDVGDRYAEEGLDVSLKEAPDHIAIELEFMYFLILKEIEAAGGDPGPKNAAYYLERQRSFLESHLGRWVSGFADDLEANARTEFYGNLGRLTESFVGLDARQMNGGGNLNGS